MATLDEVYRKFGEVSELAQLLETEIGNLLLEKGIEDGDISAEEVTKAKEFLVGINRGTLGRLLKRLSRKEDFDFVEKLFFVALAERNRLSHSFYREHNFRRNTADGRRIMVKDLQSISDTLMKAYKMALQVAGIDFDSIRLTELPTRHRKMD